MRGAGSGRAAVGKHFSLSVRRDKRRALSGRLPSGLNEHTVSLPTITQSERRTEQDPFLGEQRASASAIVFGFTKWRSLERRHALVGRVSRQPEPAYHFTGRWQFSRVIE